MIFAYLVNIVFINQVDSVFLMGEELKILVWLLIGWYFFIKLKTDFKVKVPCRQEVLFYQNKEYIVIQYAKLKNQYKKVVTSSYIELVPVIYAMMIYENHEHSKLFRTIDHLKYRFFHEKGKFGIMQVYANYELTDEGSIQIAIRKLERIYSKCLKMNQSKEKAIEKVLQQYKGKSGKFIFSIYREIVLFDKE